MYTATGSAELTSGVHSLHKTKVVLECNDISHGLLSDEIAHAVKGILSSGSRVQSSLCAPNTALISKRSVQFSATKSIWRWARLADHDKLYRPSQGKWRGLGRPRSSIARLTASNLESDYRNLVER